MPRTIRFHLVDENADPRIAAGLRLHDVDISTTPMMKLVGASDDEQLAYATSEVRVIVTQDADFLRMARTGKATPGIIFFNSQSLSIGAVIRGILLIWEVLEPDEIANRIEYL